MANRKLTILLGSVLALGAAAPANAALVYVKGAASTSPKVYVADDDGTDRHELGPGHSPTISDNGRWVAWVKPASPDRVVIRRADRRGPARRVGTGTLIGDLHFSPNSRCWAACATAACGSTTSARGRRPARRAATSAASRSRPTRGRSCTAARAAADFGAPSDLYTAQADGDERERITRDRRSLNPLWTVDGIVHDRQRWRSERRSRVQPVRDPGRRRRLPAHHAAAHPSARQRARAA